MQIFSNIFGLFFSNLELFLIVKRYEGQQEKNKDYLGERFMISGPRKEIDLNVQEKKKRRCMVIYNHKLIFKINNLNNKNPNSPSKVSLNVNKLLISIWLSNNNFTIEMHWNVGKMGYQRSDIKTSNTDRTGLLYL